MTRGRGAHVRDEAQSQAAPPSDPEGDGGAHRRDEVQSSAAPADRLRCTHEYVEDGPRALVCATCGARTNVFRLTYRLVEDLQRVRLAHGNRIRQVLPLIPAHVQPPRGTPSWEGFFTASADVLAVEEHRVLKLAERLLTDDPVGRWMLSQKGIGPSIAVSILGECWPLARFANPQKLWAYAGLHVKDGQGVKRTKGQRANWNARLKTRCWLFSQSILKGKGPWRDLYDARKRVEYEKVGAHIPPDAHTEGAPDRDDSGTGAHSVSDTQATSAPGSDRSAGPIHGDETQGRSAPADPERGEAQTDGDTQSATALSRLHLHNRALRFVMKRLLRDLWVVAHDGQGAAAP